MSPSGLPKTIEHKLIYLVLRFTECHHRYTVYPSFHWCPVHGVPSQIHSVSFLPLVPSTRSAITDTQCILPSLGAQYTECHHRYTVYPSFHWCPVHGVPSQIHSVSFLPLVPSTRSAITDTQCILPSIGAQYTECHHRYTVYPSFHWCPVPKMESPSPRGMLSAVSCTCSWVYYLTSEDPPRRILACCNGA